MLMLLNQLQQLLSNLRAGVLWRNIEHEMSCFTVERITLLIECFKFVEWIGYLKQGAIFIVLDTPI